MTWAWLVRLFTRRRVETTSLDEKLRIEQRAREAEARLWVALLEQQMLSARFRKDRA